MCSEEWRWRLGVREQEEEAGRFADDRTRINPSLHSAARLHRDKEMVHGGSYRVGDALERGLPVRMARGARKAGRRFCARTRVRRQ